MDTFFETLRLNIPFIVVLAFIYLAGMIFFWYESKNTSKNRNSVFDMWFFMTIVMLLWGRVTYVIAHWYDFSKWDWFWLPYERYGDTLYIFRAMPWRLLRVWDGGFLFIPMFLAYLVAGYIFTIFVKKWRWREMFLSIMFSANFLLGLTLFFYGVYIQNENISRDGLLILMFVVISHLLLKLLQYVYRNNKGAFIKVSNIYMMLFLIINVLFLSYTFLQQEISGIERYHVFALNLIGILFFFSYIFDIRNPDKGEQKQGSNDGYSSVSLNQAIKVK